MGPQQVLVLWVSGGLKVMAMKRGTIFSRAAELESHDRMQFSVIPRTYRTEISL